MQQPELSFGLLIGLALSMTACSDSNEFSLSAVPELETYCLDAQRIVTRTNYPVELVVHEDFDAFVKSKAVIEGPTIQQYVWRDADAKPVGVSCKLKSADHLNLTFGAETAGPDGACQDMNRAVFERISRLNTQPVFREVVFEPVETVSNKDEPGMTGPDWLAPYTPTWVDEAGALHVKAKGFQVDFTDERFSKAPPRFRGIHYCHFVAPQFYEALLAGTASPDISLGRLVDTSNDGGMTRPTSGAESGN
ncbi:MAG: hypothetical protein ACR2QB_03170 [Gammaproteobacteria bacterium]